MDETQQLVAIITGVCGLIGVLIAIIGGFVAYGRLIQRVKTVETGGIVNSNGSQKFLPKVEFKLEQTECQKEMAHRITSTHNLVINLYDRQQKRLGDFQQRVEDKLEKQSDELAQFRKAYETEMRNIAGFMATINEAMNRRREGDINKKGDNYI